MIGHDNDASPATFEEGVDASIQRPYLAREVMGELPSVLGAVCVDIS